MNKAPLLCLCLFLSACSTTSKQFWFQSTDSLVEDHQYQKAIEQAERSTPIDKNYIRAIKNKANKYRRKQLKRLQTLLIQKQWGQAQALLFQLKATMPWHIQFKRAEDQLSRLRQEEELRVQIDIELANAQLLKKKINQANFNSRNRMPMLFSWLDQFSALQNEKEALTEKLINLSSLAVSASEYALAQKTFEQALEFNSDLKQEPISKTIYQGLRQSNAATIIQRQNRLIAQLNTAINEENFEEILRYSSILSNPPFQGAKVKKVLRESKVILSSNALELEQMGDKVYRQGNISSAIELWMQAKALYPSLSGLQDKLSRAQKVQRKLQSLRNSQNQ